jgi:hypothetical protein
MSAVTKTMDELYMRIMEPEKSLEPHISKLSQKIIELKRIAQDEEKVRQERQANIAKIYAWAEKLNTDHHAANEFLVADLVNRIYRKALNEATPETISKFLVENADKVTEKTFKRNIEPSGIDIPDRVNIETAALEEYYDCDPIIYLNSFKSRVHEKFLLFSVDVENKQQAIIDSENEVKQQAEKIKAEADNLKLAASLKEKASAEIIEEFDPLKKSYEIDMPDTQETLIKIVGAYIGNIQDAQECIRAKSVYRITIEQMGNALCALKKRDQVFQPKGIVFKVVEKL